MIETLSSAPASLDQEDLVTSDLEITGITFADGDLSRPRYPSLIDHSRAPGVQFEPGIQLISNVPRPFTVLYNIDPSANVIFKQDGNLPVVQSVAAAPDFGPVPGLSAELLDSTTCRLTWNQTEAVSTSTALRILCEPSDRTPTGPEQVDGGVYLTIVHRHEAGTESIPAAPEGVHEDGTIEIRGTDSHGRPRYDLFHSGVSEDLAPDLELEISFRVRAGASVELALHFSVATGSDLHFESIAGQVVVQPDRPEQLQSAASSDQGEKCSLHWVRPAQETTQGQVASFFLKAADGDSGDFAGRAALAGRHTQIDPTIIQPPSCTSSGICITQ